jgi:hypothetical protein
MKHDDTAAGTAAGAATNIAAATAGDRYDHALREATMHLVKQ